MLWTKHGKAQTELWMLKGRETREVILEPFEGQWPMKLQIKNSRRN